VAAMQKKMHSKGTTPAMKKKLVFALNARKWKKEDGGLVEQYDLGGWIKENSQGIIGGLKIAGGAALMATGVGAAVAPGLIMSGVGDMGQEVTDGNQGKAMSDQMAVLKKQQLANVQAGQVAANQGGIGNVPTFPMGGVISGPDNVELEKKEVSQAPDGSMKRFNLPSHANATRANQMAMQPGTRIYSDKLLTDTGKTVADEADVIRKQIERYEQILNS